MTNRDLESSGEQKFREAAGITIIPPRLGGELDVSGGRERPLRLDHLGLFLSGRK